MPEPVIKKSLALITDTTFYPIYFKKKLEEFYFITPLSSQDFELDDLKFVFADVIVIDDKNFGETIFSLLTHIRRMPHYYDKPIIIITAKLKKGYIDLLIKAGANDFIREPLEDKDVFDRLKNVEKYHEMTSKLHILAGKMTSSKSNISPSLKHRFLLDKHALSPIYKTINEGGYIVTMIASVDQMEKLDEDTYEKMTEYIKLSLRKDDLLFALGSGKFIIFCNNTSAKKGFMIAQSLKDDVSSEKFNSKNGDEKYTLSIGITAQRNPVYKDIKDMINDARSAAVIAKETGNQIIIYR